jgi:hypothetical protein
MKNLPHLAMAAAVAFAAASPPSQADYWGDYANAQLGDSLRASRSASFWTDLVARPSRNGEASSSGARTWVAENENPWANTYGTPSSSRWRVTRAQPYSSGIVRMCSCYLPADARSWDGGPLTQADITRLCRAQCY